MMMVFSLVAFPRHDFFFLFLLMMNPIYAGSVGVRDAWVVLASWRDYCVSFPLSFSARNQKLAVKITRYP